MIELTFNCFFAIQSVLSINMNSPIRKLLVLTNQSSSGNHLTDVLTTKEANMKKYTKYIALYINFSEFSSFIFQVPVEKVAIGRRTSWY